jgi:DNA (cytosine-5)-methyltransferase 1
MLYGLDLFSGIGGISLALAPWVKPIAYCENDRYAKDVLLSRMRDGQISSTPIWDDVTTLLPEMLPRNGIDIIFGGFPCQDISVAGNGAGLEGKRSGLFHEIIRLTKGIKPAYVFLENVPAIRTRGLDQVLREFTNLRYDCRWSCISAAEVGAPHLRKRWFLLAHSNGERRRNEHGRRGREKHGEIQAEFGLHGETQSLADCDGIGLQSRMGAGRHYSQLAKASDGSWWAVEPDVGRVAHGISNRVDRIKCLGNSVVPLQARVAFKRLMGLQDESLSNG